MTEQYEEIAEMFRSVGRSYSHKDIETRMGQLYDPDCLLALLKEKGSEIAELKERLLIMEGIYRTPIGELVKQAKAAEQKVAELELRLSGRTYFHSDELVEAENKRLVILVREANQNVVESNYLLRECEEKFLDYTRGGCIKMRSDLIKRIQQFLKEEKT